MSRGRSRALRHAFAAGAALASCPGTASAFDYSEHHEITRAAIAQILAADPQARPLLLSLRWALNHQLTDESKATLSAETELVEDLKPSALRLNEGDCVGDALLWGNSTRCFGLPDIPALSGDHAGSPLHIKYRWFDIAPCAEARKQRGVITSAMSALASFSREDESPEDVDPAQPNRLAFLQLVRRYRYGFTRLSLDDQEILSVDDRYALYAIRGHPHFRPALAPPSASSIAARRTYGLEDHEELPDSRHKPADHAYAWYADLHLGAMVLANAARDVALASTPPVDLATCDAGGEPQPACVILASSLLMELSAQHYLQDSGSAGHMITNADRLENASLNLTHDRYCESGIDAVVPQRIGALCPSLSGRVGGTARIYGDHQLMRKSNSSEATPTLEWAAALSRLSLAQVLDVARVGRSWLPKKLRARTGEREVGACISDETLRKDPAYDWACSPDESATATKSPPTRDQLRRELKRRDQVYQCLSTWWETPSSMDDRQRLLVMAWDAGEMRALELVPVPRGTASDLETYETFSGAALEGRFRMTLVSEPDAELLPEVRFGFVGGFPRNRIPLNVGLELTAIISTDDDAPALAAVGGLARWTWPFRSYTQLEVGGGAAFAGALDGPRPAFNIVGSQGFHVLDKDRYAAGLAVGGGFSSFVGGFATFGIEFAGATTK